MDRCKVHTWGPVQWGKLRCENCSAVITVKRYEHILRMQAQRKALAAIRKGGR